MNVLGPIGFRADVRGRTIPNFYHETINWPAVTGGLLPQLGRALAEKEQNGGCSVGHPAAPLITTPGASR